MKKRIFTVTLLFFGVFVPAYLYLALRLTESAFQAGLLALPFISIIIYPFIFLSKLVRGKKRYFFSQTAYLSMGALSFLSLAAIARDIVGPVTNYWFSNFAVWATTGSAIALGTWWARIGPRIKRVQVPIENLHSDLKDFVIVQISDLHLSDSVRGAHVEKIVKRINLLKADLIALTGDIGDGQVSELTAEVNYLSSLSSRCGSFYVPGNHEYYWNISEWLKAFRQAGLTILLNQGALVTVGKAQVFIAGVTDPAGSDAPDLQAASSGCKDVDFRLLLSHRPGIAGQAAQLHYNLQLSGHTHGGQFYPWTLVVRLVHRYSKGLYKLGNTWIYVSPGTGSWGPRIRLGTRPEITRIELVDAGPIG
jgi:predicted MPP superfamily phosphohydrolase